MQSGSCVFRSCPKVATASPPDTFTHLLEIAEMRYHSGYVSFRLCLFVASLLIGFATFAPSALSAAPKPSDLDAAFEHLAKLEQGQDLNTLRAIDQTVAQAHADAKVCADLEKCLVAVLEGKATDLGKDYACVRLSFMGTDASVPALARLLPNKRLSHNARDALEGIGGPVAAKSLRESIAKTAGRQRVGVVISLGRMADTEAAGAVAALLDEEDAELRQVAVKALGRIGTVAATEALSKFAAKAPDALKRHVVDAWLLAVERLCRKGRYTEAAKICRSLQADPSQRVQAAALRGLIQASPSERVKMIVAGLAAEEPWRRAVAADCLVSIDKPEQIQAIAAAVPGLPVAGKIEAFAALKNGSHPAIREVALKSLDSPQPEVRAAALATLIRSGTASDVAKLAALAATCKDKTVCDAALATMRLMPAEGTAAALLTAMADEKTLTPDLVRCALGRRSLEFTPGFLKAAASSKEAVRLEAFRALETISTEEDAAELVALLSKTPPGKAREAASRAVWMCCGKIADPAKRPATLLDAMKTADVAGKCALLPPLARLGGKQSLAAVHTAMKSDNKAIRDAGYRALANWPDASVADELLDVAKKSKTPEYRIWTLRAYARVVSLPNKRPPQKTFEMLTTAMRLATRPQDKQLIVSRLSAVRVPEALEILVSYLYDPELKAAAVPAVFTLAKGLSQSHPQQAKAALEKIRPMTKDLAVRQQIPRVLRDIEARKKK